MRAQADQRRHFFSKDQTHVDVSSLNSYFICCARVLTLQAVCSDTERLVSCGEYSFHDAPVNINKRKVFSPFERGIAAVCGTFFNSYSLKIK